MFVDHAVRTLFSKERLLKVLDLAAAPGGKSTLLLDALPKGSLLVVNGVIQSRFQTLKHKLARWGRSNFLCINLDPRQFSDLEGFFDLVLVDAPCNG